MSRDILLEKINGDYLFFIDDDDSIFKPKTQIMKIVIYVLALVVFAFAAYKAIVSDYTAAIFFMVSSIAILKLGENRPA